KKKSSRKHAITFDVKQIGLENIQFRFLNRQRHKKISFQLKKVFIDPVYYADGIKARMRGDVIIDELLFKKEKGAFLKNTPAVVDLNISYFQSLNSIFVSNSSEVVIHNRPYHIGAYADLKRPEPRLILHITGKDVNFKEGLSLMDAKIQRSLSQFDVHGPIDVDALIITALGKGMEPELLIDIRTRKNNLTIGDSKIPYSDLDVHGRIISLADSGKAANPTKAVIIFDSIKGKVFSSPFTAYVIMRNFKAPYLYAKAKVDIDAAKIKFKSGQKFKLNGFCYASIVYVGPASHIRKETFLSNAMKLNADLRFEKVGFRTSAKAPLYVINGKARLNNDDLMFSKLQLITKGGNFSLDGFANHFTLYATGYSDGFDATLNARTDLFALDPLLVKQDSTRSQSKNTEKNIKKISNSNFNITANLDAKKFSLRQLRAENVTAKINYGNSILSIPKLKLNTCKGTLEVKASLHEFTYLKADVTITDADVKQLLKECEEFRQKAITSDNIQGDLSAKMDLTAIFTDSFSLEPGSLAGKAEVKLKNGHLINYEPLQNISHFIFRNRDFQDITFTEINETFYIQDNKMQINELEIASSVLNMYIEGIYDFKGESNINMRIPWSNLKRRGKNYVPQSLGEEGKDAKGLKLNYHGQPDKLKLRLGNH
ncbi:MAG: hypothetical protein ACXVPD_06360, partial [Bacteroidia bacterium]